VAKVLLIVAAFTLVAQQQRQVEIIPIVGYDKREPI